MIKVEFKSRKLTSLNIAVIASPNVLMSTFLRAQQIPIVMYIWFKNEHFFFFLGGGPIGVWPSDQ
jgi:hypothetical protein